ncbi:uncharacterized protein LOC132934603 [Metopolophium dirhodum]|uniref:uncharacterized protein LOC132934603 n=1 Tax=Metopolophium dirhodum TaxID=44670 RepID=UPI00298F7306|nr:uncharacterized protein LOC132934603 [Metopolophium dirhodum]
MVHHDAEIVSKTMHNFKTKIGNEYSTKDVLKVWDCISKWIENNISRDKGMLIKGIGYFTVARWELNESKVHPNTIRKPVFVIDEKLAKDFNLKRTRPYNSATIPERYLNVITIAQNYQLNIDMVTHCFKEVVAAFRKLLFEEKNCELPFPKIGKLQIKNKMVKMKYYQEFLDRQNQHLKNRIMEDKNKNQAINYNPDWDADQYESRKRPCSAMSTISRPASSLSQYRPATGYEGVLPNNDCTTNRPSSRLSVHSTNSNDDASMMCRPGSRQSVCSYSSHKQARPHSRPTPSSSQQRSETGCEGVLSNTDGTANRTNSRLSVHLNDDDDDNIICRPESRQSVGSNTSHRQTRHRSRSSLQSHKQTTSRPCSRTSVQSIEFERPVSRSRAMSCDEIHQTRPRSRTSKQNRPSSRTSVRPVRSNCSMLSKHEKNSSSESSTKLVAECTDYAPPELVTRCVVDPTVRPCSNLSTSKLKEDNHSGDEKNTLIFGPNRDETLCQSCNLREYRLRQIDNIYYISDLSPADNRDNFMKGDNSINGISSNENLNKRKDRLMQISNYNYNTAKELCNAIENEKKKNRKEKNNDSCILKKRPSSITNFEKRVNFKHSLLDQIENNKIKKEKAKIESLKSEKLMENELLKSLYDERIRNIEAKKRSKEDYLIILDEHLKNKTKITEEQKIKDKTMTQTFIFGPDQAKLQKLNNCKHRQIANYQLKQKNERNLELQEQKEKNIDFERSLLNRLKEKDETLQRYLLQKKLSQKKFLSEDLNKLLAMSKIERRKNEVPGSYPMSFPLKKTAKRCRICKKNGLGFPVEKISKFMY